MGHDAIETTADVIIIGAGGAGMMCAIQAGRRGRRVLLLDHARKIGGKILISGGGRCNFTNLGAGPGNYVSSNPHFCKSALSRYPAAEFIALVHAHGIPFHEKKLGQLFCDRSAEDIVRLLQRECENAGAQFALECGVRSVAKTAEGFVLETARGELSCERLVVATGGLSIPKLGATGFGYEIARQFGLKLTPTAPALDGLVFGDAETQRLRELAGLSIDCVIRVNSRGNGPAHGVSFRENILFTHSGLSGPAALQASLHWYPGDEVEINLLPELPDCLAWFLEKKRGGNRGIIRNLLAELLPARFAERFCALYLPPAESERPLPQTSERALEAFCARLHAWKFIPSGTVGYGKAEVTRGGVDTAELSSKTMESSKAPGLFFVGEVIDVTGWLGGYNFQWAWASGWAAGQVV